MAANKSYQTGAIPITGALTGAEIVEVNNGSPQKTTVTTQQIATLAAGDGADKQTVITPITTVGAGTLTAAALTGGIIARSGPVAAYTDTTATAAQIVAAIANAFVGQSFVVRIQNLVAFNETLAAGAGVTLAGSGIIPPNSVAVALLTLTSLAAVTITVLSIGPITTGSIEMFTNLTTAGAGTITAAGIVGGITNRTGPAAAFADTTDTAALIIAAVPNAQIGQAWEWTYQNNVAFTSTIGGGVGVTVTGGVIAGLSTAVFLVTYTAAGTLTIVLKEVGLNTTLPPAQTVTNATGGGTTAAVGDMTGAMFCNLVLTAVGAANYATRTAAQMFADIPNCQIGFSYMVAVRNTNAGTTTITAGVNVTLTGTFTIAQNTTRLMSVVFTDATHATIQSMGVSAAAA